MRERGQGYAFEVVICKVCLEDLWLLEVFPEKSFERNFIKDMLGQTRKSFKRRKLPGEHTCEFN